MPREPRDASRSILPLVASNLDEAFSKLGASQGFTSVELFPPPTKEARALPVGITLPDVYHCLFSNNSKFAQTYYERRGDVDVHLPAWKRASPSPNAESSSVRWGGFRDAHMQTRIGSAGTRTLLLEQQRYVYYVFNDQSASEIALQRSLSTPDVEYGSNFRMELILIFHEEAGVVHMTSSDLVHYNVRNPMVKTKAQTVIRDMDHGDIQMQTAFDMLQEWQQKGGLQGAKKEKKLAEADSSTNQQVEGSQSPLHSPRLQMTVSLPALPQRLSLGQSISTLTVIIAIFCVFIPILLSSPPTAHSLAAKHPRNLTAAVQHAAGMLAAVSAKFSGLPLPVRAPVSSVHSGNYTEPLQNELLVVLLAQQQAAHSQLMLLCGGVLALVALVFPLATIFTLHRLSTPKTPESK
eukprot:TRINITY_DN14931_c0_g1_i1.p1 TRINITY_DN14931_c0_g1~~TRINITY_DN14931_c0_g1_i1.p1  ORF type:complete len:408 (-),score=58.69 TRINITY_DN14931_c0_g1_i1:1642-2865(-)